MLLLLDNYDSFTYNLAQYFGELGCELFIARNDAITVDEIAALVPSHICISPGPGAPREAGISKEVVVRFGKQIPILGVCMAGKWCAPRVSCTGSHRSSIIRAPRYCRVCRRHLRLAGITRSSLKPIHFPRASRSSRKLMGTRSWRSAIVSSLCMACNFILSRSLRRMAKKS